MPYQQPLECKEQKKNKKKKVRLEIPHPKSSTHAEFNTAKENTEQGYKAKNKTSIEKNSKERLNI